MRPEAELPDRADVLLGDPEPVGHLGQRRTWTCDGQRADRADFRLGQPRMSVPLACARPPLAAQLGAALGRSPGEQVTRVHTPAVRAPMNGFQARGHLAMLELEGET